MKSYAFEFLAFFVIIFTADAVTYDPETVCRNVQYRDSNVQDKPDLIVIKSALTPDYHRKYWCAICYVGKKDYEGRLAVEHSNYFDTRFEFDSEKLEFYKGQSTKIQKINLDTQKNSVLRYALPATDIVKSLALDWVTRNLYFMQNDTLKILSLEDTGKTPRSLSRLSLEKNFNPIIRVAATDGYLVIKDSNYSIIRFDQDGGAPLVLYANSGVIIYGMTLDHFEDKVYWMEYEKEEPFSIKIRYTSLHGGDVETFEISRNVSFNTELQLSVDMKYVYFVTTSLDENLGVESHHLQRALKSNGEFDEKFDVVENKHEYDGKFGAFIVIGAMPQHVPVSHPCKINNGGCDGFCVGVPDRSNNLTRRCIDTDSSSGFIRKFIDWLRDTV